MGEDLYDEYEDIDTEDGVYVWTTNGGCPICDALEGEYDEEPTRPHELCDCEITFVRNILSGDGPNCSDDIDIEVHGSEQEININGDDVRLQFSFTITCYDGSTYDKEVELFISLDEYEAGFDSFEEFIEEAMEEALEDGYAECESCQELFV
ncbi:MAG: hypothetical protein IPG90_14140 [Bacteroidetes bacterium]|nr:hypothetical protein [Bacteroidota bacterium]MBP6401310.1 hypothetical protein [Bacteroidia bacterium]MBK6839250.1 hypothetical protein [Bacteroidota bacterium]MBK9524340.1 hypothetical protein [Bacteroidota bacterium]MBK9543589.1 hypothetical protein [Bacteroidota bacterium]